MRISFLFLAAILSACGGSDDSEDAGNEGPYGKVKLEFFGKVTYADDDIYELSCYVGGFLVNAANTCKAISSELTTVENGDDLDTVEVIKPADESFTIEMKDLGNEKVEIDGVAHYCFHYGGSTYNSYGDKNYLGAHTIITTKAADKPSGLDSSAIFAVFPSHAEFCDTFE